MSAASQFFGGGGGGIGDPVPDTMKVIEFLLVGGGGGGGSNFSPGPFLGGNGGAGEMVEVYNLVVANGDAYSITIGAGGAGVPNAPGATGSTSSFGNIITAGGGGGGGRGIWSGVSSSGGSGGGRGHNTTDGSGGGASIKYAIVQNIFDVITSITSFASPGGDLSSLPGSVGYGGGAQDNWGGGKSNSITGSPVTYAAGGTNVAGTAGTANTGNGGGGNNGLGGSGGSGVCIIRWPTAYPDASSVSGNTPTPAQPGYYVYRWNGDGSITF